MGTSRPVALSCALYTFPYLSVISVAAIAGSGCRRLEVGKGWTWKPKRSGAEWWLGDFEIGWGEREGRKKKKGMIAAAGRVGDG